MRKALAALLLIAPSVFAQTADLRVTALTIDRTTFQTGERFTVSMRWRNFGPDAAHDITAELGSGSGIFVVTGAGTSNWPCEPSHAASSFVCRGSSIAAGAEAHMVVTMRAPARGASFVLPATVRAATPDPAPENNRQQLTVQLTPAEKAADLSISPREQTHRAAAGGPVSIPVVVTNQGPAEAQNVIALMAFEPGTLIPIEASGAGWNCQHPTHSPWIVLCLRSKFAAGLTAPITVTTTAPQHDGTVHFSARVSAEEIFDANAANDASSAAITAGTPPVAGITWRRILVPLMPAEVPGANGARWKTDTTILTNGVAIEPQLGTLRGGQFIYVNEADEARVQLNSRVWDLARETATAGSEVPIVREREFTSSTIALLGIPVAAHYRHNVRIYDFDGRDGARVAIRLYANDETSPRAAVVRTLGVASAATATPAQLPVHPAYLELDPASLAPLAGVNTMRVEIEPLDQGLRLWSFISVTNNETHHVTTFSQQ
ncbi:MAG TPA: hypothetical protein VF911_07310 [Thermoanaerobaculia bacterium]|jgi:hypothetical protein